jgi:tetratricopeptide (TPR) repeat protein
MRRWIFLLFLPGLLSSKNIYCQKNSIEPAIIKKGYATVQGHKMYYETAGKGNVTVVFENGHGDNLLAWDDIFSEVTKFAKAIRYDRMGYGFSDSTAQPRTLKQIATELHSLLQQAKLLPPYILVGHSMGGATIRAFTSLYKDEVAGLVFVDPFTEFEANGMGKAQLEGELNSYDSVLKISGGIMYREFKTLNNELLNGFPEINSFGPLPDIPMILLLAGTNRPPHWEENGIEFYKAKLHDLSETKFVVLPQSPHYIQSYDPALVVESIRQVVFPNAEKILRKTLNEKGVDSTIVRYKKMKAVYPKDLLTERVLNNLGYAALNKKNVKGAIALFALNVMMYPGSYNVYDSFAEAYMSDGNKTEAIKNYEKSVALNPHNLNAVRTLKKLKE